MGCIASKIIIIAKSKTNKRSSELVCVICVCSVMQKYMLDGSSKDKKWLFKLAFLANHKKLYENDEMKNSESVKILNYKAIATNAPNKPAGSQKHSVSYQ